MKIIILTIAEVEYIAFESAKRFMAWDEPIPDFGTRFPNILESCLKVPFQMFNRQQLYRGLIAKAGILFYLMIKNHPFENGNKRIAVMTLLYFLYKNGKWLRGTNRELYEFAKEIASSDPKRKESSIFIIEGFLAKHLASLK